MRIVYSHIQQQYILGDGRKIHDSQIHPNGELLQTILQQGKKISNNSWFVNKENIDAFYTATQQMGMCRSSVSDIAGETA